MSLSLELDANFRLLLEPGARHEFTAAYLASYAGVLNDPQSERFFWNPPGTSSIQLKPLQLNPDFLNHQAQLDQNCVVRLGELAIDSGDALHNRIYEINIGTTGDPWINHLAATNLPGSGRINGLPPGFKTTLQDVANQSETGSTTSFDGVVPLPNPVPNALIPICSSFGRAEQNEGWLFRWWVPPPHLGRHQTIYAFVFAQYCALCRGALCEIYEDTSAAGTRTQWTRRWRESLFTPGQDLDVNHLNPNWPLSKQLPEDSVGKFQSLMIVPLERQKILFLANTGKYFLPTIRAYPQRTLDGNEWDILRKGPVEVWGLTPVVGQFQIQRLKYHPLPMVLSLPDLKMDYTPLINPTLTVRFDADAGSMLTQSPLSFPRTYTFPTSPTADDCPDPTNLSTGISRTFGETLTLQSSPDGRVSPEVYSLELTSPPVFFDNPSPAVPVSDTHGAKGAYVTHVEMSLGSNPGDGRMTATVLDIPDHEPPHIASLADYQFRSEMPVCLKSSADFVFAGYTDRLEVQPWRGDPTAPLEMRLRCNDRWHLLESTILREQRDWQMVGHISVVDNILRQCGIDTGELHDDGTFEYDNMGNATPVRSGGSRAEYPAGWDGTLSSSYNTPLGTPTQNADNVEGNKLLGWKPQPHDTGATFLRRIADLFSNWLMGFRPDGTFYYLPYRYFTQSSVTFHAHAGNYVATGLGLSAGGGTVVHINPGTAQIGSLITAPPNDVALPVNAKSTLYLRADGTATANTTGLPPPNSLILGTATTDGTSVTATDDGPTSPRQTKTAPIYRRPLEYRTIEPSGNFVQVIGHFQLDQTANRSGLFVDWASFKNPKVVNYLGRPKWFIYEAGGAFTCAQLNRMAYIVFQAARRRRLRVSFDGTYIAGLKIGQVFTLEGLGDWRLLELRATHVRATWQIANYTGEKVEKGYGLPS